MSKVGFTFDPFKETGIEVPKSARKEAMNEVADYVKEKILTTVAEAKSPVAGHGNFPALSDSYKKAKTKYHSRPIANLELTGAMLDALEVNPVSKSELSLEITDPAQIGKAEKHNNFDGTQSKTRRFIPGKGETFKKTIWDGVRKILRDYQEGEDG